MNEELKYIVTELNNIFNKEYNLISFDSLNSVELLQILCDVLKILNAGLEVQVEKNLEHAIISILESLNNIKYIPSNHITPAKFREGISTGKRSIVHPVLYWLLLNSEQVKKRAYLAKYVQKIDIPHEILQEEEIQNYYLQYLKLIDEFKNVYSNNQLEMKSANDASEISQDIIKMESDIKKIAYRLEKQIEKVKTIPNKEALIVTVKNYRNEIIHNKKLENQIRVHQTAKKNVEKQIKSMRELLANEKNKQPNIINPLEQISEELQINKILMNSQLPKELNEANKKLSLSNTILNEPEPTQEDIIILNEEVNKLSSKVKTLIEKKMFLTMSSDDKLGPFRNQANKIANKKQELSNIIMNLKKEIEDVDIKINDKQNTLHALVGGPVLHGEELKQYVTKLRDLNVIYKEKRSQLQALNAELGILSRTLDILKSLDPSLTDALKTSSEKLVESNIVKDFDNDLDIKNKCRMLAKEINKNRVESTHIYEELTAMKKTNQLLNKDFVKMKETFDQSTGFISSQNKDIEDDINELERSIKLSEEKWQILRHEIEKDKNMLKILNEETIDDLDKETKGDSLKERINKQILDEKNTKKKLEEEFQLKNTEMEENKEQIVILMGIINILKCK